MSNYKALAQIDFRIEQLGRATYKEDGKRTKGKGSPTVTELKAIVPFKYKKDEKGRAHVWGAVLNTKFTSLHNDHIPLNTSPAEIFNLHFGVGHIRQIKEKQTIMIAAFLSMYSSHANLWEFRSRNIFYSIAGAHIWELHPNLQVGAGGIITMFFGYPLPIPFPYVKWKWGDKYMLNVQFISSPTIKISMMPTPSLCLSLENSLRGSTAVETVEGVKKMFNHSYRLTALEARYKYKKWDFYAIGGITHNRKMKYRDRKLKSMLKSNKTNFNPTPYLSVGVKYNLF